jgi:hypothetical protein
MIMVPSVENKVAVSADACPVSSTVAPVVANQKQRIICLLIWPGEGAEILDILKGDVFILTDRKSLSPEFKEQADCEDPLVNSAETAVPAPRENPVPILASACAELLRSGNNRPEYH